MLGALPSSPRNRAFRGEPLPTGKRKVLYPSGARRR